MRSESYDSEFLAGLWPIFRKELIQILRDPMALFLALLMPTIQMLLLGVAVDTNVRQIKTVVYDLSMTRESRELLDRFINTDDFKIVKVAHSDRELYDTIVGGNAKVGIKIPADYSRLLIDGSTASVLVLVDGSESSVTSEAVNVSNGVTLQESLQRILSKGGTQNMPVETRHTVLFNPSTRSANFFIPGLIAVLLQQLIIILVSFSVVREREKGTLEQLYLSPISPLGLMVGKMLPYGILAFIEVCFVMLIMRFIFDVPIHGSPLLLLFFAIPFILTILGLGLIISTRAHSQTEAIQLAMSTLLPSIFLSGYIFSTDNLPLVFRLISKIIPTTYFIETLRGIVLRGASIEHLWLNGLILLIMGILLLLIAAMRFRAQAG
ncbi:MAG: ABC transporter permease [Acidobacteriota bacterium]